MSESKKRRELICLALAVVTVGVYCRVAGFDFINFDDPDYVTENAAVKGGLTLRGIVWAFTHCYASNWHPITWISHMLDYQLFGLWAGGHHLVNLLFHVANTIMIFLLLHRLTGAQWRSAIVAGLFALHPLHVESVAWIAERKDVLSTFFGLLSLLAYVDWVRLKQTRSKVLALVFFALGLLAKPMLVTLPCLMLLLDFWPLCRVENTGLRTFISAAYRQLIVEKWPWFVLIVISCVATFYAQKTGGSVLNTANFPFFWRVINAVGSYFRYTEKVFYPVHLALFYPLEPKQNVWAFVTAATFLTVVSLLAVGTIKRWPWMLVGWLWFLGTLVPVIGLVQVGFQEMADRYTYVPAIGLFIIVVWMGWESTRSTRTGAILGGACAGIVLVALAAATVSQVQYWRDSLTLFSHAVAVTSDNALAQNNLGVALAKNNRKAEALAHYAEAVRLQPGAALFQINFGAALATAGRPEAAIEHYLDAIRINPAYPEAYSFLGITLLAQHKLDAAITNFYEAVRLDTNYSEGYNNLGNALSLAGKSAEALPQFAEALRLNPTNAAIQFNCGLALTKLGREDEAVARFAEAVRLDPGSVEARYELGRRLFAGGQIQQAFVELDEAVKLKPDHASAQLYLGLTCLALQNGDAGLSHLREAARLRPGWAEPLSAQAWALATSPNDRLRDGPQAVRLAEMAAELTGHRQPAILHTLAAAYAEAGRFDEAITTASQALELAQNSGQSKLALAIQDALQSYQAHQPFRPKPELN